MRRVWLFFPLYLVQVHLPSFVLSEPFSTTRWAALPILKSATPPYCIGVIGLEVQLWAQLICVDSHHSLVRKISLSSSGTILQSILVSAQPKTSNSHLVIPCRITVSLCLCLLAGNPPIFWNPILKIFFSFFFMSSPKVSSDIFKSPCQLSPSPSFCCWPTSEGTTPGVLTRASSPRGAAGIHRLLGWVILSRGRRSWIGLRQWSLFQQRQNFCQRCFVNFLLGCLILRLLLHFR